MWASTVDRLYEVKQTNASSCVKMGYLPTNLSGHAQGLSPNATQYSVPDLHPDRWNDAGLFHGV